MFYITMLLVYLALTAIMLVPVLGAWFAASHLSDSRRSFVLVVVATVLLTPSWGPASLVVVPVPFGVLFFAALLTWSWGELARWVSMLPLWHAIAFPATACAAYFLVRKRGSSRSKTDSAAA